MVISRLRPCRGPLGCWLVGFSLLGFVFSECLYVCWLAGFWMFVSRQLLQNGYDFQSERGYFRFLTLPSGRPDASILDPGRPFWQLGGILGSQGSSRIDTLASGVGFFMILGRLHFGSFSSIWECYYVLFLACF